MNYNGNNITGPARYTLISKHLASCFIVSSVAFSTDATLFFNQVNTMHSRYYSFMHQSKWNDYTASFTLDEVASAINKLDAKKDHGPMGIPVVFVQHNITKIAPILLKLFNIILNTGTIPTSWKKSFIQPIPKKGSNSNIANYRGIAMQSVIPKLLDRLITDKFYRHLDCLLPHQQHGFRAKKSTTTNLLEKVQYIFRHLKPANCINVIYFDYTKAFDQVDHGILARKLLALSTPLPLYRVILSFITNRTYQLKADGQSRDEVFPTTSSVPQGSQCGPILFLIMCYDISACVRNTNVQL